MLKIQFLTSKKISPNTHSIIYPILKWEREIESSVGKCKVIRNQLNENSDIVILDSKFHKSWWLDKDRGKEEVIKNLKKIKNKCGKLVYFDTTDSSGSIQNEVFDFIDQYWKGQLLKELNCYKNSFMGGRIFTDFFYNNFREEFLNNNQFQKSKILESSSIKKLRVAWNSSLTDYSLFGGRLARLGTKLNMKIFLEKDIKLKKYLNKREKKISCRVYSDYSNKLISWQRNLTKDLLKKKCNTDIISKNKYHLELLNSKMIFSPFGWGEICYRDFETFFSGALLIKPNMSHLNTWPNLYIDNETYIPCRWDLTDLLEIICEKENDLDIDIINNARNTYNQYLNKSTGGNLFCARLRDLVKDLLSMKTAR